MLPPLLPKGKTEEYCMVQDIIVSVHVLLPERTTMMENRQGDRKGTPVPYTKWLYKESRVWYGRTLAVALTVYRNFLVERW